jgi:uncharacterized protein YhhL (DUF1145 family)
MNTQQLSFIKKALIGYWISVAVVIFLFRDSNFGEKYILFGALIFLVHVIETFIFDKVLKEHSTNVIKDKLLMLPFGFVIPASLKAQASESKEVNPNE